MRCKNPFEAVVRDPEDALRMLMQSRILSTNRQPFCNSEVVREVLQCHAPTKEWEGGFYWEFANASVFEEVYSALVGRLMFPPILPCAKSPIAVLENDKLTMVYGLELSDGLCVAPMYAIGEGELLFDFYCRNR